MSLAVGSRLGEWTLAELLGEGAFGQVWRAHASADGSLPAAQRRWAALKVPRDERGAALLHGEGALAGRLQSPRFPKLLGVSHDPPYAAFELVAGRSLRERLQGRRRLAPAEVGAIARGVLEALADAHAAGLVHRDLKPENVLVTDDLRVVLVDLGLAVPLELANSLDDETVVAAAGTLPYLPPEVREGGVQDGRGDLYAFGVLLFEALTGSLPAAAELPSAAVKGLPAAWDELYRRACAARERRYASAKDALVDLRSAVAALPPAEKASKPKVDVGALLEKAAGEERALLQHEFMAFVTPSQKATARVGGKSYTFDVAAPSGLCVLRATSPSTAVVVRRFGQG